ncbi:MAG: tRNA lysidine(34) synthetase TilS [Hyphomonadaceae bacterium]
MLDRLTIERMLAWTGEKPVLVALSGGGDSVALLHLLLSELGADHMRAVVVDHSLRDGSDVDAKRAAAFASALGVSAEILTLRWEHDANRAQQSARAARYRAICGHARVHGVNTIAVAHTADDQAETVLMRAANGSTWRGLAGIAPFAFAPIWPEGRGIALARPLLGVRRAALRAYLNDVRAAWIEDPANTNPQFERVRVRQRLAERESEEFDPMRLVRLAERLRARSDALDERALELIARATSLSKGVVTVSREKWSAPREVRRRALSALMVAASGAGREPPWTEMEALECRSMNQDYAAWTNSGVEFRCGDHGVALLREQGAVLGRADGVAPLAALPLAVNVEAVWDGRIAVRASEPGWRVVPARNKARAAFENGPLRRKFEDAGPPLCVRSLAAERVAHAFAPDINRSKP